MCHKCKSVPPKSRFFPLSLASVCQELRIDCSGVAKTQINHKSPGAPKSKDRNDHTVHTFPNFFSAVVNLIYGYVSYSRFRVGDEFRNTQLCIFAKRTSRPMRDAECQSKRSGYTVYTPTWDKYLSRLTLSVMAYRFKSFSSHIRMDYSQEHMA